MCEFLNTFDIILTTRSYISFAFLVLFHLFSFEVVPLSNLAHRNDLYYLFLLLPSLSLPSALVHDNYTATPTHLFRSQKHGIILLSISYSYPSNDDNNDVIRSRKIGSWQVRVKFR